MKIVAGMLIDGDKFLIGQRKSDNSVFPDYWELPGGKIDDTDETPWHAIKREWMEELEIGVFTLHSIPERTIENIEVYPFLLKYESGKAKLNEHQSIKFIKFSEINNYLFTPITKEIIHIVKGSYSLFFKPPKNKP
jgi:mutator protein MutT